MGGRLTAETIAGNVIYVDIDRRRAGAGCDRLTGLAAPTIQGIGMQIDPLSGSSAAADITSAVRPRSTATCRHRCPIVTPPR